MIEATFRCGCGWHLRWPGNVRLRYWPRLIRRHLRAHRARARDTRQSDLRDRYPTERMVMYPATEGARGLCVPGISHVRG